MNYADFIASKAAVAPLTGIPDLIVDEDYLFPFQQDIVRWALRRGRAAVFSAVGTGKSRMQLYWAKRVAEHTGGKILVLAPLAVAAQTVREGKKVGIESTYCRAQSEVTSAITIANYEMLDKFDASTFDGIVIDESSCLKNYSSAIRTQIIETFKHMPFRLACSATPAPNDHTELGNHAEFLGIMSRQEMLSMYFVHDGGSTQDWRIKGHAREAFWKWVCSWAAMVRKPSDLGYPNDGYDLPPLNVVSHVIPATIEQARASGRLFVEAAKTLQDQRDARRVTLQERVAVAAKLVNDSSEAWLLWCDLNDESAALAAAIPGAVEVVGSDSPEFKAKALLDFADGRTRVLVSKSSIAGFGLNFQQCHNMAFVGVSHSYERYTQAIGRCYRFGQEHPVNVHLITSELEGNVLENLQRKEREAQQMADEMSKYTQAYVRENVRGAVRDSTAYEPKRRMALPTWLKTEAA